MFQCDCDCEEILLNICSSIGSGYCNMFMVQQAVTSNNIIFPLTYQQRFWFVQTNEFHKNTMKQLQNNHDKYPCFIPELPKY